MITDTGHGGVGSVKEKRSQDVLIAFKGRPDDMSTSEVAEVLYPTEFEQLNITLNSASSPQEMRRAKTVKARLHRRVLYHLERLAGKEMVRVTRVDSNGEKHYALDLKGDEEIVLEDFKKRKLVIHKPRSPSLPTEGYEEKKALVKFGGDGWLDTVNAVLLDMKDLQSLYKAMPQLYAEVNDLIAANNFSNVLNGSTTEQLMDFFKRTGGDCDDFDRTFCVIVDVSALNEHGKQRLLQVLRRVAASPNIEFVFETSSKEMQEAFAFYEELFRAYGTRKVYFKNKDVVKAPFMMGKAGPYTVNEERWKKMKEKPQALVVAQTTLMIDVKKFCETFTFSFNNFEDLIAKTLKSLFCAVSLQRRRTESCFKQILSIAGGRKAFDLSQDYVRFWNYDFLRLSYDSKVLEGVFRLMRRKAHEFSTSQEMIYTSCGMPVRFKSVFSVANTALSNDYFTTSLDRSRLEVSAMRDFYSDDFRAHMKAKEMLADMFDGGFHLTVHKKGDCKPEEAVREASIMLSTYKMPFFGYASESKGAIRSLTSFVV